MAALRIILGPMPRLMEEIIRDAAAERSDRLVVASVPSPDALATAVADHSADAVILCASERSESVGPDLLRVRPSLRVLSLRDQGRRGQLYWVERFGALSARQILDVLGQGILEGAR